jgi:hypothetical protein
MCEKVVIKKSNLDKAETLNVKLQGLIMSLTETQGLLV